MNDYNLAPGEFVIMQEAGVRLGGAPRGERITELVLTSMNIILVNDVQRGLFQTERLLKRCPLNQIQRYEDEVQTPIGKQDDEYRLQVLFPDETISIIFADGARRTAERWARAIQYAADGDFNSIEQADAIPSDIAEIIDGARDIFGSITKRKPAAADKKPRKPSPKMSTVRCPGCHAPLSGAIGTIASCPYCDTKHALKE